MSNTPLTMLPVSFRQARLPVALALALTCLSPSVNAGELVAKRIKMPITLDGVTEEAWASAPPLQVTVDNTPYQPDTGYPGIHRSEVQLRALYDDQHLYLLVQYQDPTESLKRQPWIKQQDGSWQPLKNIDSTGHENTYYEDKFSILWNINARGFEKKGCDVACHMPVDGKINGIADKSAGRKFLREGETVDMWHWKSVRSNPVGQTDDQYIDSTQDPKENKNWGRRPDHKTGGGYSNNTNADNTAPLHMAQQPDPNTYWLMADQTQPLKDQLPAGSQVPGIIISAFEGSRGDIATRGVWKDGQWTLEMRRALITQGPEAEQQDVQFKDLSKGYAFGLAVFDNSQINHLYHSGSHLLRFDQGK